MVLTKSGKVMIYPSLPKHNVKKGGLHGCNSAPMWVSGRAVCAFLPPVLKTIPSFSEANSNSKSVALHMVAELTSVVLMHEEGISSATSADANQPH